MKTVRTGIVQIDEEHQFGVGAVDERGVKAKGKAATGYPEWVMTKVSGAHVRRDEQLHFYDSAAGQWTV